MPVKQELARKLIPSFFGQTEHVVHCRSHQSVLSHVGGYHSSEESLQYDLLSTNHNVGDHRDVQSASAHLY